MWMIISGITGLIYSLFIVGCTADSERDFIAEAKQDCAETVKRIEARPGASWASEYGWMYEDQCERLERGEDG